MKLIVPTRAIAILGLLLAAFFGSGHAVQINVPTVEAAELDTTGTDGTLRPPSDTITLGSGGYGEGYCVNPGPNKEVRWTRTDYGIASIVCRNVNTGATGNIVRFYCSVASQQPTTFVFDTDHTVGGVRCEDHGSPSL